MHFLVPADLDLRVDGSSVSIRHAETGFCRIVGPPAFAANIHRGVAGRAVRSRRFGELEAAQRIVFSGLLGELGATTRLRFGRSGTTSGVSDLAHVSLSTTSRRA
jgi:hypothetical protein